MIRILSLISLHNKIVNKNTKRKSKDIIHKMGPIYKVKFQNIAPKDNQLQRL